MLGTGTFRGGGGSFRGGGEFPLLGSIASDNQGVYFAVIERDDEENPSLVGISPFVVARGVKNAVGDYEDSRSEMDGARYVVKVRGNNKMQKLLKMKCLSDGTKVKVVEHAQLNFTKVVISAPEVAHMTEDEILEELADQHVTEVRRLSKKVSPSSRLASVLVLRIHKPTAPQYITVGLVRKPTRPFYPRPTRCFNCLEYGHIGKNCKKNRRCQNCCNTWHDEVCNRPTFCLHCNQDHSINSPLCRKFKEEQEIVRIRIQLDVPFSQARRIFSEQRGSYSQVTQQARRLCTCKCSCSTNRQDSSNSRPPTANDTDTMTTTQIETDDQILPTQNTLLTLEQTNDDGKTDSNNIIQTNHSLEPNSQQPSTSYSSKKSGKKSRNNTPVGHQPREAEYLGDSPPRKKTQPSPYTDVDLKQPQQNESRRTRYNR